MRSVLSTAAALALAAHVATGLTIQEFTAFIEKLFKAGEIKAVNEHIDKYVKDSLAQSATIQRPPLLVHENGSSASYRVLQIPDLHYTNFALYLCDHKPDSMKKICVEKYMTQMTAKMLDDVKPDYVVFSGDQIESLIWPMNSLAAIDTYSAEVNKRKIPWSMVFGNHDDSLAPQLFANKKIMMAYIETVKNSYAKYGPFNIGGAGNYEVAVQSPTTNATALRMYFMDTGRDGTVTEAQKAHMKTLAASHKNESAPALMFFHFPIEEYKAFNGTGQGGRGDPVSAAKTNSHLFDTMVEMGDVKASFCGHDHFNDFCFYKSPLHLCYGGSAGYGAAYGKGSYSRRARVIDWKVSGGVETISTWQYFHQAANTYQQYKLFERNSSATN
ncbi:hypothetical protein SPRG_13956 [Saprolegnia parasitica CBS 223.65]|uniref:Calcineurin-like phosphoesterase domain-containing protein n=1 Tax=Saprolegnia parasitica (strain CBS 223.65) TaxID=695850 RepID=A0A067BRZ0_SAPPC|nr:hypothetical protein SPRG_13956 [Saprolegnia parasitica CBS 223.65]KDO21028.1 hypothetical protein SPRG_13956 [Saprolegnia parasitica CBS 223.65]|eukprot:XP_012208280.1 hypothetical protein SPRG_13956 [Saprolegnia parasitica CBS 223.65]